MRGREASESRSLSLSALESSDGAVGEVVGGGGGGDNVVLEVEGCEDVENEGGARCGCAV